MDDHPVASIFSKQGKHKLPESEVDAMPCLRSTFNLAQQHAQPITTPAA
jgi:hypothetical protein